MKRVLSVSLLAVLMGMAGCARYHPGGTSPYYTSYYNTYDSSRNCYYHCCDYRGHSGFGGGSFRGGRGNSGGHEHHSGGGGHHSGGHEHHHDSGHDHHK